MERPTIYGCGHVPLDLVRRAGCVEAVAGGSCGNTLTRLARAGWAAALIARNDPGDPAARRLDA